MKASWKTLATATLAVTLVVPALAGAQNVPVPPAAPAPEAAPAAPAKKEVERAAPTQKAVQAVALKPGDKAPDFTLKTLDGKEFKLSERLQASKKPIVFVVGQSACTSCRTEVLFINAEAPKQPQAEFYLINVDAIGGSEKGQEILAKYFTSVENKLPVLLDPKMAVPRQYGVRATPGMFIIGADGNFILTDTGFTEDDGPAYVEQFKKLK